MQEGEAYVKKIGGVFAFKVKDGPGGKEALWVVDVKNGKGSVNSDAGRSVVFFFLSESVTRSVISHTRLGLLQRHKPPFLFQFIRSC